MLWCLRPEILGIFAEVVLTALKTPGPNMERHRRSVVTNDLMIDYFRLRMKNYSLLFSES